MDNNIRNFYSEICQKYGNNYKIVLEPGGSHTESWIEFDTVKWEMEQPIKDCVNSLLKDNTITLEEKIIKLYEFICNRYIYDATALYFCRRDCSDPANIRYLPADWYGRIVGEEWLEQRKKHNRRICYEFSRFFAKAINTLIDGNEDLEAVIVGDKDNTHYVVGLTGKNYSIILDPDDFNNIKDLTRLKMGLTINGIHVLRDETGEFGDAIDGYNNNRPNELPELASEKIKGKDIIEILNIAIEALNRHNIDSQGFFEYIRFLIEKNGIEIEKIWQKDKRNTERRYERCLYFKLNNKTYLLDSINRTLSTVNLDELDKNQFIFNPEDDPHIRRLSLLNELVTDDLNRKTTVVLNPNQHHPIRVYGTEKDVTVCVDAEEWVIPAELKLILNDLCQSKKSVEEKIVEIYQIICKNYVYDDNALTYVQKLDDELFFAPDSYGRDTDSTWKENRKKHNRRTCYEISRILAECINEILKTSEKFSDYDVCILWDEAVTHYFVGLVSDEYYVSFDIDDFTKLKDITRIKTGLSTEGIKIYYDPSNKFTEALKYFNNGRGKVAKDHMKNAIEARKKKLIQDLKVDTEKSSQPKNHYTASDDIIFLQNAVRILKEEYKLDPAGIFEYMKEIVDTRIGAKSRKKVWKEVKDDSNNSGKGKRYTRCLIVTIDGDSYMIDVTKDRPEDMFVRFDLKGLKNLEPTYLITFSRRWEDEPYDGR